MKAPQRDDAVVNKVMTPLAKPGDPKPLSVVFMMTMKFLVALVALTDFATKGLDDLATSHSIVDGTMRARLFGVTAAPLTNQPHLLFDVCRSIQFSCGNAVIET